MYVAAKGVLALRQQACVQSRLASLSQLQLVLVTMAYLFVEEAEAPRATHFPNTLLWLQAHERCHLPGKHTGRPLARIAWR